MLETSNQIIHSQAKKPHEFRTRAQKNYELRHPILKLNIRDRMMTRKNTFGSHGNNREVVSVLIKELG